ncbi:MULTISPECIES: D-hexose-6-phosphate mutarotase [unclassified Halomonas]|uniref:aldose epimerase family protein n=1 Tax=unclassified Halomonas TaxID=2609666 RepID=UPI00288649E0|nr:MULTISPECIES: D-hexose-6-phosphate mutarotase [unclassified Halomonas]MDT0500701.1 D-hexose-6-phosphate mutarotase [Halomonas sp. PAR7]MDT0513109.1 D-hexose-6-phosphate mutarotase [Halomonas sp. LES1]MDT0591480.1 D-hexose-6-phosphate mutarotase [Halomonas sp. PAR8]
MIPATLRTLLDDTDGQRRAEWHGRDIWLANETWGELVVSLQGAQVLHYCPSPLSIAPETARAVGALPNAPETAQAEGALPNAPEAARAAGALPNDAAEAPEGMAAGGWLWVTPTPQDPPGAIRGGIPLCWPWFADEHTADESADRSGPLHGPARKAAWRLDAVDEHEEGVELHLSPELRLHSQLTPRAVIQANANRLHVELITEHTGETPVKMSGALHTYLAVTDAFGCRLEGLPGARYLDKLAGFAEREQQGELGVRGALDRIYHSNAELTLDDGNRRLRIARQGSDSAVVWHPGDDALPADTPAEVGRHFLCVEAANTRLDPVWLVPGAQHLLGTTISLDAESPQH